MRTRAGALLVVGLTGAALLGAIGMAYAFNPETLDIPPAPVGWWFATLAFIGGIVLAMTAFWQWQSHGIVRLLFVVILAGLSAGWIAASALGILTRGSDLPPVPSALHWLGLALSTGLFFLALVEATRSLRELPGRGTRETSLPPAPHRPE